MSNPQDERPVWNVTRDRCGDIPPPPRPHTKNCVLRPDHMCDHRGMDGFRWPKIKAP